MNDAWQDMAIVGRIVRPHGNRGHVVVQPETDFPEARFVEGHVLRTRHDGREQALVIAAVRHHGGRAIIGLRGVETIDAAERLTDAQLCVPLTELTALPPGTFYRHTLIGCVVVTTAGTSVGEVAGVEGTLERSRLIVRRGSEEVLIPLAEPICVSIDPDAGRIVIDPPDGLLDLNSRGSRG